MIQLGRARLPPTAWSAPYALALVVAIVELYVIIFLQLMSPGNAVGDFLRYQWFLGFWTGEGTLERGLPFEFMKINVLLAVYLWLMSRAMHPRREAIHRVGLIVAALVLVALQVLLAMSSDLPPPTFELIPIWPLDAR